MSQTQARFTALWLRNGGLNAEDVYADLAKNYGEPTRHYHTLRHIRRCLTEFDGARDSIPHPDEVELALWCHDVIYVPGASDNEQRSADWFRRWANERIAGDERICRSILATKHAQVPADMDERFAADIDLSMLGSARSRFVEDGARLRAERPDLDDRAYAQHEKTILMSLLTRPRIYHTDVFYVRCEASARRNLAWRLGLASPEPSVR